MYYDKLADGGVHGAALLEQVSVLSKIPKSSAELPGVGNLYSISLEQAFVVSKILGMATQPFLSVRRLRFEQFLDH